MRYLCTLALVLMLASCASREVHVPLQTQTNSIDQSFLDLQGGWRVRVVTPILKSGGYRLQSLESGGRNLGDFRVGPDFVGYENDYYSVVKSGSGVHVEFRAAEAVKDGKTSRQPRPLVALFSLPVQMGYVRLIYLVRVSDADHNMAIVGAEDPETLASLTRLVQTNPEEGCRREMHSDCWWVPAGIAVRPEERTIVNGKKEWRPVLAQHS